ncbi:MAG: helix-turn-helix transcriptional regulator [Pseudomonadota bacterium]
MTKSLHTTDYAALVEILVDARKRSGKTQQEIAEALGKPQSYVTKIENGERRLDVVEFIDLSIAMGVEPPTLFKRLVGTIAASGGDQ